MGQWVPMVEAFIIFLWKIGFVSRTVAVETYVTFPFIVSKKRLRKSVSRVVIFKPCTLPPSYTKKIIRLFPSLLSLLLVSLERTVLGISFQNLRFLDFLTTKNMQPTWEKASNPRAEKEMKTDKKKEPTGWKSYWTNQKSWIQREQQLWSNQMLLCTLPKHNSVTERTLSCLQYVILCKK